MKAVKLCLLFVICFLISVIRSYASEESLTITTYYPSPYGSYRELRSQRMAIGDDYIQGGDYCWEGSCTNTIGAATDLVVQGSVGIGTVNPTEKLDVDGNINIGAAGYNSFLSTSDGSLYLKSTASAALYTDSDNDGSGDIIFQKGLDSAPTEFMRITNTGNVGIGTVNPAAKFVVELPYDGRSWDRNAYESIMKLSAWQDGVDNNGRGGAIDFHVNYNTAYYPSSRIIHTMSSGWAGELSFATTANYTTTMPDRKLVIKGNGNVGIGTTSPGGKLDVNGTIYQRGSALHADYVFEPSYELESIEEHSQYMWQNKHLKAVPKAQKDESGQDMVEYGARSRGTLEELEKAHVYIQQLNERVKVLEARLAEQG